MTDDEIFAKLSEIADEEIMARNPKSIIAVGRALLAAGASEGRAVCRLDNKPHPPTCAECSCGYKRDASQPDARDAEIAALRERIAEMEKDAARYRWLRNEHFPTADNPPLAQVVWKTGDRHWNQWANMIDGNDLDRAIDAAKESGK